MKLLRVLRVLALLLIVAQASLVRDSEDESGSQYLGFNGTVSAALTYPAEFQDVCKSRTLGPYLNSYLYVGVNPPWDTNPFFFELYHLASERYIPLKFGTTEDDVYNLEFASSAYACWKNSKPCGTFEMNWHYRPEILLDLTKANVKKTTTQNGEEGYEITGNHQSYITNETERGTVNGVNVASGCYSQNRFSWDDLVWNETLSWSYSITFSNNTGAASLKTMIGDNTMELIFAGERIANITESLVPEIELVMDDETKPGFRYSNDSQIYFRNTTNGWRASPNEIIETSSTSTNIATSTATLARSTTTTQPSSTGAAERLTASNGMIPALLMAGGILQYQVV